MLGKKDGGEDAAGRADGSPVDVSELLVGGGEVGDLMRSIDWARTPIGSVEQWPASLRTMVNLALGSEVPMFVLWGPELVQLYNHGAMLVLGSGKHPAAMGQRARDCWHEIWDVIWPMYQQVLEGGATHIHDGQLILHRNGFFEECYFDYGYTPIRDELGKVAGIFSNVAETTSHVLGARRMSLLRELSERTALASDVDGVMRAAGEVLRTKGGADLPFVLLYELEDEAARLIFSTGLEEATMDASALSPPSPTSPFPLTEVQASGAGRLLEGLSARIGELRAGPWPEPVDRAFLIPVSAGRNGASGAVLLVGLSPRLPFDDAYRDFLGLLARQLAAELTRLQALEDQRQHAKEAEAERQKQHDLFMQAPVAIAMIEGMELRFTFANPAYRALVDDREVVGKTLLEALPDIRGQGFDVLLRNVIATGEPHFAKEVALKLAHHAEGERLILTYAYTPMRSASGSVIGVLVSCWDVSASVLARQRVEALMADLQATGERLRLVVATSAVGTWELDLDTQALIANDVFRGMFGVGPDEPFDLDRGLAAIHPDDRDRVAQSVAAAIAGHDGGRYRADYRVTLRGLPIRWLEARGQALFGPDGKVDRFLGTGLDITRRKQAEQERETLLRLEQQARHDAEEASRIKDEFLSTVSHELRTPLNAMLGWAQMLRTGTVPVERRESALEAIERNARAQAQLIEDLLDMGRILAGKLRLEIEQLDMATIVEAAVESIRPAASAKGIRVESALASTGVVMGDPNRLQQVAWNLLSNAVKFTPKAGRVQVLVRRVESVVELTVADTGQGISAAFMPHVFERFRQADGGATRSEGGLGLGLSIVKQLVELHGGTLSVSSEGQGKGASFTVRLPVSVTHRSMTEPPVAARLASPSLPSPTKELAGLRLLVLDDEKDSREMITYLLEAKGATVTQAASADEARRSFESERADVLISDIGMPGEDGYEFIASIRKLPLDQGGNVPAVALTAYARSEDRTRALTAGFTNHVTKPVQPAELVAVIASLARHTRSTPT